MRRSNHRRHCIPRGRPIHRQGKSLHGIHRRQSEKCWSHRRGRNLRAGRAATGLRRIARHAHLQAAAVRGRMRCRKHPHPGRKQHHPDQGDDNRRPLADSTQHSVSLPPMNNLAVADVAVAVGESRSARFPRRGYSAFTHIYRKTVAERKPFSSII